MKNAFIGAVILGLIVGWVQAVSGKSQNVRLLDVVVVGPLMIWAGTKGPKDANLLLLLVAIGAATITFNGRNWLEIRELNAGGDGIINLF